MIDAFLVELEQALHRLGRRERRRAIREARDHVLCAAAEAEANGAAHADAIREAIESFGSVRAIAASYARTGPGRGGAAAASTVAVGVLVLAALTVLPTGNGLGLISTSHAADNGCASRWNAGPPSARFAQAWISGHGAACDVVLHHAGRAVIFRQADAGAGWQPLGAAAGPLWKVASIPSPLRAHPYRVADDGQVDPG